MRNPALRFVASLLLKQLSIKTMPELGIRHSLEAIDAELKDVQERREKLIKGTRDAVMLCSKSIVALHRGDMESARKDIEAAKTMLDEFRASARMT